MNFHRSKENLGKALVHVIITCIPKRSKVRNEHKNWRPITSLNFIYKLYSGLIANRVQAHLPHLIHPGQKDFVDLGKKIIKFFLNLENKNFISKNRKLMIRNKLITDPKHILKEMKI